jgi:hypothetical protein
VTLFDHGTDHSGDFSQMANGFALGDAVNLFIYGSDAGSQSQDHPATADPVEIEGVERRFDRTAAKGKGYAGTDHQLVLGLNLDRRHESA